MINRDILKTGDIGLIRGGVDFVSNVDGWGQWGMTKSPEFGHIFGVYDFLTGDETLPPYPHKFGIEKYDALFDAGKVVIMRFKNLTDEGRMKQIGWVDGHVGPEYPYGWESIGIFGLDALVERGVLAGIGNWLKGRSLEGNWEHEPVCSQYIWMKSVYGLGYDFAARYGIGRGRIMPGDFFLMREELEVVQGK